MEEKKKMTLPIKVIIMGCIIGLVVASIWDVKQINANKTNEDRKQAAQKTSEQAVAQANARLVEIEKEYNELKSQYNTKTDECDSINSNMSAPDWYTKSTKCQRESSELQQKMNALEMEDTTLKNKDYTVYYQEVEPMSYQIFYIIGASIAGLALLGAFIIYLVKGKKPY